MPLQEEALDFVRFLNSKLVKEEAKPHEPNGRKVVEVLREIAASGSVFQEIEDPVAWQCEIRQDRPLMESKQLTDIAKDLPEITCFQGKDLLEIQKALRDE